MPFRGRGVQNWRVHHAGRTEASAPTERFAASPMVRCNFVIAHRRGERGIDPYGDFTLLPFIVRFCDCIPRGRGRTPPLRLDRQYHQNLQQTGGVSPSPTLRRCGKIRAVERRLLSASRHQKAGRSGERPAFWYRRRESNPYGAMPGDFKSPVSTCSTTPAYLRILPSRAARVKGRAEKTPAVRFGRRADFQIAQALR